ncbi:subtilisin-like protein [Clavulina sp. PMI_390]|nr:subtilisin-like protein [Clavulina sp. PMI_390]
MMSHFYILIALCAAASTAFAAPATAGRVHSAPASIPTVWQKGTAAPTSKSITFNLIFKSRDAAGLEARMLEIAESKSAWMTEDEIASYIVPSDAEKATVETTLKNMGATGFSYSRNGDTLTVTSTIGQASKFFDAQFSEYSNTKISGVFYKTTQFTVPASIEAQIADVSPFATFGDVKHFGRKSYIRKQEPPKLEKRGTPASCNTSTVTPACVRSLYAFDTYTPTTSTGTARLGIMAYFGQSLLASDLTTYLTMFRPEASSYTIPVTAIDGAVNSGAGDEADLDTQTAAAIIYPLPAGFYDYGTLSSASGDVFLGTFQYFLNLTASDRPSVITISYGSFESEYTASQASSMCTAAQQLSAAGMTIVVAAGDYGVGGFLGFSCPAFVPTYPSGCPYLLTVGATQNFSPEVMADSSLAGFSSGAGFSNIFPTPSYQTSVVAAYESELGTTDSGYYNRSGRAFPDVSAQGSQQPLIYNGNYYIVGGTSASAPIVASGLTLLNDLLITAGKATVGWANPTFYANPSAFTDVTSGGSYSCASTSYGLPAETGWDASAGWGTPDLTKLRTVYGV